MPGSIDKLRCPGCGAGHEIATGTGSCPEHGRPWAYSQFVCPRCLRLVSRARGDSCVDEAAICERCDGGLEPWSGRVWLERTPEGRVGAERLEGACPRCGATITEQDSTGFHGLWD